MCSSTSSGETGKAIADLNRNYADIFNFDNKQKNQVIPLITIGHHSQY